MDDQVSQRLGAYLYCFISQHFLHLRRNPLVSGINEKMQRTLPYDGRRMLQQTTKDGMPYRLAPHLEQTEPVEHLLFTAPFERMREHFGTRGIQHSGSGSLRIYRALLNRAPQHRHVLPSDRVGDHNPARQKNEVHQADTSGVELHPVSKHEKSDAGEPIRHAPNKAINKRLDLTFHGWRRHG